MYIYKVILIPTSIWGIGEYSILPDHARQAQVPLRRQYPSRAGIEGARDGEGVELEEEW